jgi:hypothetical protein
MKENMPQKRLWKGHPASKFSKIESFIHEYVVSTYFHAAYLNLSSCKVPKSAYSK